MPSLGFLYRMEHVLSAKVEERKSRDNGLLRRIGRGVGIVGATLTCVLVLKAAAIAGGTPLAQGPAAEAGFGAQVAFWLGGADPLSSAVAMALRPGAGEGAL